MISIKWSNTAQTNLIWQVEGDWTLDEWGKATEETKALLQSKFHNVMLTLDMRHSDPPPSAFLAYIVANFRYIHLPINRIYVVSSTSYWDHLWRIAITLHAAPNWPITFLTDFPVEATTR